MATNTPTITTETALLELLREAPKRRTLSNTDASKWIVEDFADDPPAWGKSGKCIASVADELANALLDRAFAHNDFQDPNAPLIVSAIESQNRLLGEVRGGKGSASAFASRRVIHV